MSPNRTRSAVLATLLVAACGPVGFAQIWQPFADVQQDYDLQLFAPAIIAMDDEPIPTRMGIFFTYDRAYLNLTRPETQGAQPPGGDFIDGDPTWGNRYDIGYMTKTGPQEHGWWLTVWDVHGTNERLVEPSQNHNGIDQTDLTPNPSPPTRPNAVGPLLNSVNVARLSGVELNKVFRFKPYLLHYRMVLEPFFGARYVHFKDLFERSAFSRITATEDLYTNQLATRENDMVGGQTGLRAFTRRGRWLLSADARGFAMRNFQTFNSLTRTESWNNPADDGDVRLSQTQEGFNAQEFVFGGELRVELAYEITKAMAVRVGLDVTNFAKGIGRGVDPHLEQNLTMAGLTFGLTVNR